MTTLSTRSARIADLIADLQVDYPDIWAAARVRAEQILRDVDEPRRASHGS